MKKTAFMLTVILIISVFSGCTDKIETPDASTDNKNADSAAITTATEESSGSQSGTEESTAEETADATAESAEQTQAQPVVYLPEEVLKCKTWKNPKEAGEEIRSELQKKYAQNGFFDWATVFGGESVQRRSSAQAEFTEVYDLTSDYLAENSDIRLYKISIRYDDKVEGWSNPYLYFEGDLYFMNTPPPSTLKMAFLWDYDGNGIKDLFIKSIWGSGIGNLALNVIDLSKGKKEFINICTGYDDSYYEPGSAPRVSFDGNNVYVNDKIITYKDGVFSCEGFDDYVLP